MPRIVMRNPANDKPAGLSEERGYRFLWATKPAYPVPVGGLPISG